MTKDQVQQLQPTTPKKAPKLPSTSKIQKRPLLHNPIPSALTSSQTQKVIYIRANTSFIATIKRVRKYLSDITARASQPPYLTHPTPNTSFLGLSDKQVLARLEKEAELQTGEEVIVKGTGRAIERVMEIGLYFQAQVDVVVRLRTGSVGAIDDVVDEEGVETGRVRRVSCLEVGVSLR